MGFFFLGLVFCFGFSGVSVVVPVHVLKRKTRLKPATTAQFFFRLRPCCKNPSIVLAVAALVPRLAGLLRK
jgi:hypothetical protein